VRALVAGGAAGSNMGVGVRSDLVTGVATAVTKIILRGRNVAIPSVDL
jgi:hypothetical protein